MLALQHIRADTTAMTIDFVEGLSRLVERPRPDTDLIVCDVVATSSSQD
jgi:hypothetical protein